MKNKEYKILLISPDYPPPLIGGSLVYINNLINNSELKYTILSNKASRKETDRISFIESNFITDSHDPSRIKLLLMYIYLIIKSLGFRKYDCVILNISALGNGLIARLNSLFRGKTIIIAYAEELTVALYNQNLKAKLKQLFMSGYKKADMIISVSHFAKNLMVERLNVKSPINVIPTPLHDEKLILNEKTTSNRKGVLSVGRLIKRKGFDLLIESFYEVNKKYPELILTIIGDGPEKEHLYSVINRLSLESNVKIYSNVTSDFLSKQYMDNELFVLANHMLENGDCEGAPNVFIEAGAYGMPSIAGIEGGASDVVEHGETGFLIDPRNTKVLATTILEFLDNKDKLASMGKKAKLKVRNDHDKRLAGKKFREYIFECIE